MKPTKKQKQLGIEFGWGKFEVEHGYGIFDTDIDNFVRICKIDYMGTFTSDVSAVNQAKKDGFKFINGNVLDCTYNQNLIKQGYKIEEKWA